MSLANKYIICKIISTDQELNNTAVIVPSFYCKLIEGQHFVAYDSPPFTNDDISFIDELVEKRAPPTGIWKLHKCVNLSIHGKKRFFNNHNNYYRDFSTIF